MMTCIVKLKNARREEVINLSFRERGGGHEVIRTQRRSAKFSTTKMKKRQLTFAIHLCSSYPPACSSDELSSDGKTA